MLLEKFAGQNYNILIGFSSYFTSNTFTLMKNIWFKSFGFFRSLYWMESNYALNHELPTLKIDENMNAYLNCSIVKINIKNHLVPRYQVNQLELSNQ